MPSFDNYSLWEKNSPMAKVLSNGIAMGRITKVYAETREVEVKTFAGPPELVDHHIPKAQWLTTDGHPDGDESGAIPRVGSLCMVFYIGGNPWVWGFFSPVTEEASPVNKTKKKEDLRPGDRVMKTKYGNKTILRSNGEIDVHSTEVCKMNFTPEGNTVTGLCQNYEFETDGGVIEWKDRNPTSTEDFKTFYRCEYRDDTARNNIFVEEYGSLEDKSAFMYRKELGVGGEDIGYSEDKVWTHTILPTGEDHIFIRAPNEEVGYDRTILPDGQLHNNIGGSYDLLIKPTGETTININKKIVINIKPDGTTDLNIGPDKVKLKMTSAGVTTFDSTGAKFKFANKKLEIGTDSVQLLQKISDQLQNIITFTQEAKNHTHIGNLGYETMIPSIQAPWETLISSTKSVKSAIDQIKGTL